MALRLSALRDRAYADFLMPSRLPRYEQLLTRFLDAGYAITSVDRWWQSLTGAGVRIGEPVLVLRHDVDTDPGTARRMWDIDRSLGIPTSFFFRLTTLDVPLMNAISGSGGHASYHYEELAEVIKRHRLHDTLEARRHLPEARRAFRANLRALRGRTGLALDIVASHGDFANRRTGVPNWEMLADPEFRNDLGITLEAYDRAMMDQVTSRHADTLYPRFWVGEAPEAALARRDPRVYLLVHPRHWRVARLVNATDDARRAWQSVRYGLPVPGPRR
ncbi:MAG TPA: hypothetical protein VEI48_09250 [Candidatus Sulfotelmatobacter sp.]|nr:hypothetical protein [Candidatus Sulfotelmatobacter sp.]